MNGIDKLVGQRLSAARRRKGLSQLEFGSMIGRSESWVSKVETAVISLDSLSLAQTISELLGVPIDHLLALDARSGRPETLPGEQQTLKLMHLLINPRDWEMWDDVQRRWFFAQAAASVISVLDLLRHQPHADLAGRVEAIRGRRARLDAETLDGLEQITLGYRRAYRSVSAFSLIGPAYGTLNVLIELGADGGKYRDRIVSLIGQMGTLIGTMLMLDLGDYPAANHYLAIGARAAQQIDDRELMAFTLGCRAFHSSYRGDRDGGVAYADAALDLAERGINPITHGWLAAVGSEMHASSKEPVACERLLDAAAGHLERAEPADPWVGIGLFNADKLTAYRGGDLMRLGRYGEAQDELARALDRLDPTLLSLRSSETTVEAACRNGHTWVTAIDMWEFIDRASRNAEEA